MFKKFITYFAQNFFILLLRTILILSALNFAMVTAEELDPPEILLGERLFLETRFAHFFKAYLDQGGDINKPIPKGDPALDKTARFFGLPPYQIPFVEGPFAGKTFNCRNCHLVDEHLEQKELGMRSYADFASRSVLPTRNDDQLTTVRNAPALVGASVPRNNFIMHFDGEFYSLKQTVRSTLINRNLGWLPGEKEIAIEHICNVVRIDDGSSALASEFGNLSYTEALSGISIDKKPVATDYQIPNELQIDIHKTTCEELFDAIANLISIYIEDLVFAEDELIISPYDLFLRTNNLSVEPNPNESDLDYSKRLIAEINRLQKENKLTFITKNPNTKHGGFEFHDQPFQFGEQELLGMQIFFNQYKQDQTGKGNCVTCHPAPHFTDFGLHNTGVTQIEYDAIHGNGKFNELPIPSLTERNKKPEQYLPATHQHPDRKGSFRKIPSKNEPLATDLGAWNIFYNDNFPLSQDRIHNVICNTNNACQSDDHALELSIATFKTPSLRDLGHSAPYMHNGLFSDLHATVGFYIGAAVNTYQKQFRNGDSEIAKVRIEPKDINPLTLFLISLYEDYN